MSEQLKIKLSIAGRMYPLTINPNQEEGLRKAAKRIENMVQQFESSYDVRDKQDVLAMCALQFANTTEQQNISKHQDVDDAQKRLKQLETLLKEQLA